ncbi:hypothetical protein KPL78_06520 [Roseomonas sp. HJA6]|uniref:Uncharacterized protein n=1 Tax=Roseomonas alba TaxID=2846776 RepID=A0ABS7A597_9PROT|nr:hypothetical protein [Neoroseomonas alba]MBW6397492.1 hypothetical protein [Neoroseomonas alba]
MNTFASMFEKASGGSRRLSSLNVREISVVGVPAVPGAQIGIAKGGDPVQHVVALAKAYEPTGEVAEAIRLAKAGATMPRSYWQSQFQELVKSFVVPGSVPPATATHLALAHPGGLALHRATLAATA